jgi:hypothetical protein
MVPTQAQALVRYLRRLAGARQAGGPDGELLQAFLSRRDETAFAALVERHGPMVLSVGRRVLGEWHAAEDVFQATFLVLASKAASIRKRTSLGSWLYGVACRLSLKARSDGFHRQQRERHTEMTPQGGPRDDPGWHLRKWAFLSYTTGGNPFELLPHVLRNGAFRARRRIPPENRLPVDNGPGRLGEIAR